MALTTANARRAVSGEISYGLTTATAPADTTTALTGFTGLGYLSEDGVAENFDISRDTIKAWQNAATLLETITDAKVSYEFTLVESGGAVGPASLFYGATVTQTAAHGTYTVTPAATLGRRSWVLDIIDQNASKKRIYIAEGELFKSDNVTYANGEVIGYPCELVAYTDPVVWDAALKTP